jgi:solute carrier family 27 fatty acid transporter 1/4
MFGNGLRKNIWNEFATRFNVDKLVEFYGSTEGNCNVCNVDGVPGCIGYIGVSWPWLMREFLQPQHVIRVDEVSGEPLRHLDGFCMKADPGDLMSNEASDKYANNHIIYYFSYLYRGGRRVCW